MADINSPIEPLPLYFHLQPGRRNVADDHFLNKRSDKPDPLMKREVLPLRKNGREKCCYLIQNPLVARVLCLILAQISLKFCLFLLQPFVLLKKLCFHGLRTVFGVQGVQNPVHFTPCISDLLSDQGFPPEPLFHLLLNRILPILTSLPQSHILKEFLKEHRIDGPYCYDKLLLRQE